MFSFIPKEEKFFEFFDAQAGHNVQAAQLFKELVERWDLKSDAFKKLQDIEHEGDITAHEIYDRLNRTFITPFDREDIHLLASELDDVVDILQSTATRMQLYRVDAMKPEIAPMADILLSACENLSKAINEMKDPQKTRRVHDYCIEINRLENAGDRALESAIGKLFEGKPEPLEVIKWKEIYEGLEASIDKCEDVAHLIESILVKNA